MPSSHTRISTQLTAATRRPTDLHRPRLPRTIVMALLCLLVTACGNQGIQGEAPRVRIYQLGLAEPVGDRVTLDVELHVQNYNDQVLAINAMPYTIELGRQKLQAAGSGQQLTIGARGMEVMREQVGIEGLARDRLQELEDGAISSLPYHIKGRLQLQDGKELKFESNGHVYPVPGRPGQFR